MGKTFDRFEQLIERVPNLELAEHAIHSVICNALSKEDQNELITSLYEKIMGKLVKNEIVEKPTEKSISRSEVPSLEELIT